MKKLMISLFMCAAMILGTSAIAQNTTGKVKSTEKAKTEVKADNTKKAPCKEKKCKVTKAEKPATTTQAKSTKK